MRIYASVQGPQNQYLMNCAMLARRKAQAQPLIDGISARPIGSSPIEDYTTSRAPERAGDFRTWHKPAVRARAERVRSARVFQTSTCSAIARASSTSMPSGHRTPRLMRRQKASLLPAGYARRGRRLHLPRVSHACLTIRCLDATRDVHDVSQG